MWLIVVAVAFLGLVAQLMLNRTELASQVRRWAAATTSSGFYASLVLLLVVMTLMLTMQQISQEWLEPAQKYISRARARQPPQSKPLSSFQGNVSLSFSGTIRSYSKCIENHVTTLLAPNPHARFTVLLATDETISHEWLSRLRQQPNMRAVHVLPPSQLREPPECHTSTTSVGASIEYARETRSFCNGMWKQLQVHRHLEHHSLDFDLFLHTRFDVTFDRAVLLDEFSDRGTLFVARNSWIRDHEDGDVEGQLARPITWREHRLGLHNSVPDFAFVGRWVTISAALMRFVAYAQLLRSARAPVLPQPVKRVLMQPELFLSHVLRQSGVEFGDPEAARPGCVFTCAPPLTYQVLFMRPVVTMVR